VTAQTRLAAPRGVPEQQRDRHDERRQPQRPAQRVPDLLDAVTPPVDGLHRLTERLAGHDQQQARRHRDARRGREQRGPSVLAQHLPVALGAVDPVRTPLQLRERRCRRRERGGEPQHHHDLAPLAALVGAGQHLGQQ
jgi:hypothetical protein